MDTGMEASFSPQSPPGRAIGDSVATRKAIFSKALKTVGGLPPIENQSHSLVLSDPGYDGPEDFTPADIKQAVLDGKSLGRKLKATLTLWNKATGTPIASKRTTLAEIPYYTDQGTFIDNGTKYTLANQLRLNPGIYTRKKSNAEIEAHVSTLPGQGVPHRVFLDPRTGIFRIKVGQAQLPLAPLLQVLGASRQHLSDAWGPQLAASNLQKANAGDVGKLYSRLVRKPNTTDPVQQQAQIRTALQETKLDPDVMEKTLGQRFDHVNLDTLLATTRKLLAVHNRYDPDKLAELGLDPAEEDDRDNPAFMHLMGPEDTIAERITGAHRTLRPMLWKAMSRGNLNHVPAGLFQRAVRGAFLDTGLGGASEEVNPLQLFDQQMRVTRMGVGGIPSADSIPESARSVQGSHYGIIDPVHTPESMQSGVDVRFPFTIRKGENGEIYAPFRSARTGQIEWKQPKELFHSKIAFSNELERAQQEGDTHVYGLHRGKIGEIPRSEVDYDLPHFETTFSPLANLVPMKSGMKGQRASMAARMLSQALPLDDAESPLVQSGVPGSGGSYESLYGPKLGAIRSLQGGQVVSVLPHQIEVAYEDGSRDTIPLANQHPGNRKTPFHQTAIVQAGQRFAPGDLLARSNYTNAQGEAALGRNLRVGFMTARGFGYEDAVAMSQSAANKSTSQHLYQHPIEFTDDDHPVGKQGFPGIFPGKYKKAQLEGLDDDGVAQIGRTVEFGDPLVLRVGKRTGRIGTVSGARSQSFSDQTETWQHHSPGVVTDVSKSKNGVNVAVRTSTPLRVGDKISLRAGNKGVVGKIVPDDEMPVSEDGQPLELLLNPKGIISRSNPSQIVEAVLGKIAAKTGQSYIVHDFQHGQDLRKFAEQEALRHGVKDLEDVYDPVTGKTIPQVLTGNMFTMKLHHVSESKEGERAFGDYTSDGTPAKGGPTGAKTWGMLHLNALLSHNASGAIADAHMIRGQRSPQYWSAVMSGRTPPEPESTFVHDKYLHFLQGTGINPVRRGSRIHLMALTNPDIEQRAGSSELVRPETVDWNDAHMAPVPGGLFDEKLFGDGNRWGKITLHEPMPNPVMEDPIRKVLGLTTNKFREVLAGREQLHNQTGPQAIQTALDRVDVAKEANEARHTITYGRKTARNDAIQKLRFLQGSETTGVHPRDWMWNAVPVLPPKFRPISKMSNGVPIVADPNYLYRELFEANRLSKASQAAFGNNSDERLRLYDSMKAVSGLGDPTSERLQQQQVKGLLQHIVGSGPKNSMVQRKLLGVRADLVGRGTIIPNPDLDMDEIAIPENMAWSVYQPFVVRHLVQQGVSPLRAATLVSERSAQARASLQNVMKERPVIADRSPVWHRNGIMAFHPRLTSGSNIETNTVVQKGFNADFDGNCVSHSTVISLEVNCTRLYRSSRKFFNDFRERTMRVTGATTLPVRGLSRVQLPIGELPRIGLAQQGQPGQTIYELPPGLSVLTYSHETGGSRYSPITHLTMDENHDCRLVTTARGRTVEVSSNESLCCYDSKTGLIRKTFPDESVGQLCPVIFQEAITGTEYNFDLGWWSELRFVGIDAQQTFSEFQSAAAPEEQRDIVPIPDGLVDVLSAGIHKLDPTLYAELRRAKKTGYVTRAMACRRLKLSPHPAGHPLLDDWLRLVQDSQIHWDTIKTVVKAPRQTVYDLAVPETKVFAIGNGLVVYDTMQVHVPATDRAVQDALTKMTPSRNLLDVANFKPMYAPTQEFLYGLYELSQRNNRSRPRVFSNRSQALAAFRRGEINADDPLEIMHD